MRQFSCWKNVALTWVSRIVAESTVRGIRICVNYGLNTMAGRFELCTHSILGALPSCCLAETRQAMIGGTTFTFQLPIGFTTNTWSNYERKG